MKNGLRIEQVDWEQAEETLRTIRHQVFVEEQKVSPEEEWDGQDREAVHFLALREGQPVGCARLQQTGKIQRMAVVASARGSGVGAALLSEAMNFARARGDHRIFLDAQLQAQNFYRRFGFEPEGGVFQDAGIPHQRMAWRPEAVIRLAGPHTCVQALRECASLGRQSIDILTDQLASGLYGDEALVTALGRLARRSRRSRVRILVRDTRPLRGRQHPLVTLSQRLPSSIALRALRAIPEDKGARYLIVDREALVFFNDEGEYTGFRRASARAEAQHLLEEFNHLWEHYGFVDPNLKQLSL